MNHMKTTDLKEQDLEVFKKNIVILEDVLKLELF